MMKLAPQELRTFFVTTSTLDKRALFMSERMAEGLLATLRSNYKQRRFSLHAFVIMPDHIHLLITPAEDIPLEKAMQFIKGGFSFKAKKELGFNGEIWGKSFSNHRIRNYQDFEQHRRYIERNPARRGLREPYKYVYPTLDPCPAWLIARVSQTSRG
jgi:putative transposase